MPAGKYQILVVDGSAANRSLLGDCLSQLGDVEVCFAHDGRSAIGNIAATAPSLVLLDMHLPDTDGIELVRRIRNREVLKEDDSPALWMPVIFLSSRIDDEVVARCIIAGGDDFLPKPVSEVILLAKIRAMLRIVGMQREIHAAHRRLKHISTLDGLTGIPNRRHFDSTLNNEWKRCLRTGSPLSLILIDVDLFKQYNDRYGHQAGDHCLKAVAAALNEALFRVEDSVARYGGEEFAAVLPGTGLDGARAVAQRMLVAVRELSIPHETGIDGRVSCSFGIASCGELTQGTIEELLKTTDQSLYLAKHRGRNRIEAQPETGSKPAATPRQAVSLADLGTKKGLRLSASP